MVQLETYALPGEKWHTLLGMIWLLHTIDMFPEHPKSCRHTSKHNMLNVFDLVRSCWVRKVIFFGIRLFMRLLNIKDALLIVSKHVWTLVLLWIYLRMLMAGVRWAEAFTFVYLLLNMLLTMSNHHEFIIGQWFIVNVDVFCVWWNFYERLKALTVLDLLVHWIIVLYNVYLCFHYIFLQLLGVVCVVPLQVKTFFSFLELLLLNFNRTLTTEDFSSRLLLYLRLRRKIVWYLFIFNLLLHRLDITSLTCLMFLLL